MSYTWIEGLEEYIEGVIKDLHLDPKDAFEQITVMAEANLRQLGGYPVDDETTFEASFNYGNVSTEQTAAERYKMLIHHFKNTIGYRHVLQIRQLPLRKGDTHALYEVTCNDCDWWDHWDEPK